jgi:hypothetical protein
VLYELLTGRPPRTGASLAELVGGEPAPIVAPTELAPNVPRGLETVVMRSLAADPAARPESASDFAAELVASLQDAPTRPLLQRTTHRSRGRLRRPALFAAAALAAFAVGIAVALALPGGGSKRHNVGPQPVSVSPVPHSTLPAQQARNLAAWLRRNSG